MYLVWISEQTAIIFLYKISLMVLITEKKTVYRAVGAECLSVIQVNFHI